MSAPLPNDLLASLRDYHLPEAVSWWPPAPGWWLLAFVILLLIVAMIGWLMRRRRRRAAARAAERELARLRGQASDAGNYVRGLSMLLRRFALAAFPHRDVASLTGDAWLTFLDQHGGDGRFADGVGRQLVEAPYRSVAGPVPDELGELVADWIRRNREVGP